MRPSSPELSWAFEQLVRAPATLERVTQAAVADDEDYLEATVKEILRRRPKPFVSRRRDIRPRTSGVVPGPPTTIAV